MKEIWINLELHIESYEFYNFQGFFRIFLNYISIFKTFLNKKNIQKKKIFVFARGPRGCDVARKATWQCHADSRSAYVARYTYIYIIYYSYKRGL